jgi:hypothetical protein
MSSFQQAKLSPENEVKTAIHHSYMTIALSVASFLIAVVFPNLLKAEEGIIEMDFKEHTVTADIEEAPLRTVIEEIKKEVQGVWFKIWLGGSVASLDERISVEFKDLSIRNGMERVFSAMNYSLVFDKHYKLIGVFILGKPAKARGARTAIPRRRAPTRRSGRYVRRK